MVATRRTRVLWKLRRPFLPSRSLFDGHASLCVSSYCISFACLLVGCTNITRVRTQGRICSVTFCTATNTPEAPYKLGNDPSSAEDHHYRVLQTMVCAQWMTTFCDALIACLPASTIPLDSCPKQAHGNHLSTNSCPPRAADPDACYQKLVELKNGETFNGHLVNCDNFMNITLREVYQTSADGDRFWKLKECYIRGSTVRQPIPFFSPAFVWISQRRSWSVLVCTGEPNPTQPMQSLHAPDKIPACTGYPAGRGERGAGTRARGKSELKRDGRRS